MFPGQLVRIEGISFENFNFNRLNIDFSYIPAGTFIMGSPTTDTESFEYERPQHKVTLTKPFLMQRTPVTQEQFFIVMGRDFLHSNAPNLPVESVSWFDAIKFCNKLSSKMGLPHAYIMVDNSVRLVENATGYRLPTEAEWEYACRAGTTTPRYGNLDDVAWYDQNSSYEAQDVGLKKPNAWNLYDMLGNVWEWTQDWYESYSTDPLVDPKGPEWGSARVRRGGSWDEFASVVRAGYRGNFTPGVLGGGLGFRICRTII